MQEFDAAQKEDKKLNTSDQLMRLSQETVCVHAGVVPEFVSGAIMTPIFQTSTYVQDSPGNPKLYDYARAGNPTRDALEGSLSALEGAKFGLSYSSGLAATQAIVQLLEPGAHVLVSEDVYGGTGRLFRLLFARYGITFEFIDMRDLAAVAASVRNNTKLLWLESPTNPLLRIVDIAGLSAIASRRGALTVVDNTFASPIFQQPLAMGADLVMHSSTKYIGGHSDLIGGAVMTNSTEVAEKLKFIQFAAGSVNSPFECFLLLRSIKTLAIRMKKHHENGMSIAAALKDFDDLTEVIYPGLPSHPQFELARRQMKGFSGIISIRLKGGMDRVRKFLTSLKIFALAESLGGVESLANHPETMTHVSVPPDLRVKLGISPDLVRLSVGIEDANDLLQDIRQALEGSRQA
ncbi:MAG TPA: PLP-dependent aspartate aminotransferase family protein [Terriglobia bacterium]|nr:PLP-dependent aspartate aminotransferase family protein [Terriglobia bacterium]